MSFEVSKFRSFPVGKLVEIEKGMRTKDKRQKTKDLGC